MMMMMSSYHDERAGKKMLFVDLGLADRSLCPELCKCKV